MCIRDRIRYGSQGLLLPLDEYLDNAPNFSSLLEQYPQIRQAITMPDGHIYSLPFLKMGDNVRLMDCLLYTSRCV